MFKNLVKEYLESSNHSLETLKNDLGVSSRIFPTKHGDLVILSYSQIDSPKTDPVVRMCRGLVLEMNTWNIVSFPFYRFYNFEEVPTERVKFNWKNSVATEKIDGSLLEVFNYKGEWLISTRSMIGGENQIDSIGTTVNKIFDMAISPMTREEFFERLSPDISYIFEIVSPFNQIVTQWDAAHLYLIGGRSKNFEEEEYKFTDLYFTFDSAMKNIIRIPKVISLYDKKSDDFIGFEKMKMLAETGNSQDEGFVVVDYSSMNEVNSFPRVKVKNSAYVALHHLRGSLENGTPQYDRILTLIFNKEEDEVLANLPHLKPAFDQVREKLNKFLAIFNSELALIKDELNNPDSVNSPEKKKEFALKIKQFSYTPLYFVMLKMKVKSFEELVKVQLANSVPVFDKLWDNYISKI